MPFDAAQLLAQDGPIAALLGPSFEARPQQVEMARAVARTMQSRGRLLVEAGTGVGKSFAYLAPAIAHALENPEERVVVATNTISLQEQLLEKDAPVLRKALAVDAPPKEVRVVLVKGRGNYVSLRRLQLASQRQDRLFADDASLRSLHAIEDWTLETLDGSLATLPQLERHAVWDRVQSDAGNCMGRRCKTFEKCFFQRARRRMESARVLICNHALFFSDLALRQRGVGFLPEYHHVILDEAHGVEDVASDHFGVSLAESRVQHLLSMLHNSRTHKGYLSQLRITGDAEALLDGAIHTVMNAGDEANAFFERLDFEARRSGAGYSGSLRINAPGVVDNTITPVFKDLALRLKRLKEAAADEEDKFELNSYAERAALIAEEAESLIDQTLPGCVYWVESSRALSADRPRRMTLACSPIDVGPILREKLFDSGCSVILTSATLTTGADSFNHITSRLGCADAETLALGSPFDLAKQVEVHIHRSMPDPRSPDYLSRLCAAALDHIRATDGGAFILFTSLATMHAASELLTPELRRLSMPLWVQNRDGARGHILEKFRADPRSVLMGVSSFWQGVDVRGRSLRNVIIARLPFDPPDRPLTEARLEQIKARGGDPFFEDSLPRAVIRFKQGFGRLIRSATDTGRVVVLDPRIVTKGYGKAFLATLPQGVLTHAE